MPRNPDLPCANCGKLMWRKIGCSLPVGQAKCWACRRLQPAVTSRRGVLTPCAECGVEFVSVRTSRGDGTRTCSVSCGQKLRRRGAASSMVRKCEICSEQYRATHPRQRTCGRACGVALRRASGRPWSSRPAQVRYPASKVCHLTCKGCEALFVAPRRRIWCRKACSDAFWSRTRQLPVVVRSCAECAGGFSTARSSQRYCSIPCSRRTHRKDRERARKYGVAYEPVSRRRVFERDRWRCGICKGKVDSRLSYPHDKSASLDHIVPMSLGGDHLYVNVQLAHLKCNVDKGAEDVGGQLALVG